MNNRLVFTDQMMSWFRIPCGIRFCSRQFQSADLSTVYIYRLMLHFENRRSFLNSYEDLTICDTVAIDKCIPVAPSKLQSRM